MNEIERKFLVTNFNFREASYNSYFIVQGFLNTDPDRTVRIRRKADHARITVKGPLEEDGMSRFEWEKDISVDEANDLLELCEYHLIEKTRYEVKSADLTIEVDVFHGENQGLIVAEIELDTIDQYIDKPEWLGVEITGNSKYYNANLSKKPFRSWN